jgi:hypothetical protein
MGGQSGTQNLDIREYEAQREWSKSGKSAVRRWSDWSESNNSGQTLGRAVVTVYGNLGRYEPRPICTYESSVLAQDVFVVPNIMLFLTTSTSLGETPR